MSSKRQRSDLVLQTITYVASFISILTLFSIVFFVLTNGLKLLNLDLIRNNYESQNVIAEVKDPDLLCICDRPVDLPETVYYSSYYGVGLIDSIDLMGKNQVEVFYVHPDSPLNDLFNKGVDDVPLALDEGDSILRIAYSDRPSSLSRYGAAQMILELDAAVGFRELEYTVPGGGIRGSIITTLYLIVFTLLMALPIGVGVAIYLNEYAKNNRFTRLIRSLVELLTGVPSIIYGLMGLAFFVPFIIRITSATSGSILSGAMTLAVILLPVIIRTTEESLKVVPDEYRTASLSLGASKTQTTFKIVLPSAFQGILTSTLLAIGRIIGESAALVFAIGTTIKDDIRLTQPSTSLAVHIWAMMTDEPANIELSSTIALIILFIVLLLNMTIKFFSKRLLKKAGVLG